jgi:hypothetical protein
MVGPVSIPGPVVVAQCDRCGGRTLCQDGLCSYCRDIFLWSLVNRSFCALIHRDSPQRRAKPSSLDTAWQA